MTTKALSNNNEKAQRPRQLHKQHESRALPTFRQQQLLAPLLVLFLLLQHKTLESNATPLSVTQRHASDSSSTSRGSTSSSSNIVDPCAHKSIAELIRTSPVIVKALGARIFSDGDDDDIVNLLTATKAARQVTVSKSATQTVAATSSSSSFSSSRSSSWSSSRSSSPSSPSSTTTTATSASAILITLTPETIYKGASLLKMTPGHGENGGGGGGGGGGVAQSSGSNTNGNVAASFAANAAARGNSAESAYQYEGQLNATLKPLGCFDANMLKMLPMELIAFGSLMPATQQQQQQQQLQLEQPTSMGGTPSVGKDILHISINGLHRWTPQFEHHIWKHLGWDDWSDFTLCSVTCGKGVQQRFRRCLLDNPMVNINMNMNLNDIDDDDDDDGVDDDIVVDDNVDIVDDDDDNDNEGDEHNVSAHVEVKSDDVSNDVVVNDNKVSTTTEHTSNVGIADNAPHKFPAQTLTYVLPTSAHFVQPAASDVTADDFTVATAETLSWSNAQSQSVANMADGDKSSDVNEHKSVAFVQYDRAHNDRVANDANGNDAFGYVLNSKRALHTKKRAQHKRKHKSAKSLSTLFCEGYNIEQRNCNTFECSDDINDLLKFYKKLPMTADELAASALSAYPPLSPPSASSSSAITTVAMENDFGAISSGELSAANGMHQPSSTPSNMGYIRNWRNSLNFTLMITLRAKNDTKNTATIFSIRNATHNLYLEACKDGLRLYLERDNTTEMLPVKFNLYDYRWHQVAISIQNGDFISIYVDCLWTNSFVVSKRLYSLPLDADVEIGRGFNGELQQLLVLPEHEERHQCSNKRTSINEVKRYIIDTFIDDYAN